MIEFIDIFVAPLERQGLRYLVTGSVASMVYGEPRLTNDIDLILELKPSEIPGLSLAFPESEYYLPPPEVIQTECVRPQRGHFNIFHLETMLKADVYLAGTDPLHCRAFEKQLPIDIEGTRVIFAPADYVILRKLEFFREGGSEKHLRDIASILSELGSQIDSARLAQDAQDLGLIEALRKARDLSET